VSPAAFQARRLSVNLSNAMPAPLNGVVMGGNTPRKLTSARAPAMILVVIDRMMGKRV
jgi:hypothetical protein